MNIIATAVIASAITAMPVPSLPTNPIEGLSISAAGVALDLSADGIETHLAETTDFKIELHLKSGSPIRVRL